MASQHLDVLRARKGFVWVAHVVTYVIYFYLIVVEIILIIGFFLLLFGANPAAGFTQWAYRNLDRVMEPFRGIFTPIQFGTTSGNVDAVFDTSVVFAMIIYGILAMVLSAADTVAVPPPAVSRSGRSRRRTAETAGEDGGRAARLDVAARRDGYNDPGADDRPAERLIDLRSCGATTGRSRDRQGAERRWGASEASVGARPQVNSVLG